MSLLNTYLAEPSTWTGLAKIAAAITLLAAIFIPNDTIKLILLCITVGALGVLGIYDFMRHETKTATPPTTTGTTSTPPAGTPAA